MTIVSQMFIVMWFESNAELSSQENIFGNIFHPYVILLIISGSVNLFDVIFGDCGNVPRIHIYVYYMHTHMYITILWLGSCVNTMKCFLLSDNWACPSKRHLVLVNLDHHEKAWLNAELFNKYKLSLNTVSSPTGCQRSNTTIQCTPSVTHMHGCALMCLGICELALKVRELGNGLYDVWRFWKQILTDSQQITGRCNRFLTGPPR